jgi:WD40 repeat protein
MSKATSSEKTPGRVSGGAVGWKTVSVFVSSTFDDMHAERDYLVKEVFPRLREWCEQRRLRLVDVDLRWGVTEADATNNKRVVDVCLRRIDDCRPFFICLLGQRYGWIPRRQDVTAETSGAYPHIAGALGAASVTEMEIQHSTVAGKHVSDAFFYLRDPSYLADLPSDPAQLRQRIYTDEAEEDAALRKEKLRALREQKIPATGRPVRQYSVHWNAELRSPEIALPPQCPATLPENIETWRKNWQRWAGVRVGGTDVDEDPAQAARADTHNQKLTGGRLTNFAVGDRWWWRRWWQRLRNRGRLTDFDVGERPLGEVIFEDLQRAIAARFPDRAEVGEQSDLQRELDLQEELIAGAIEGFIGRVADLAALDQYADSDDARLVAVVAAGGIGKTTLLAKWIADRRDRGDVVFCRFIGVGDRSCSVDSLLASLLDELRETGRIQGEIPTDPKKLRENLPELLAECGKHGRAIIVIDALNQLESRLGDLDWLPKAMPAGLKIVVSFKTGTAVADELLGRWRAGNVQVHECRGFEDIEDRKKLVTGYLKRHLKELDQTHLETLVTVPGAENPLYLRVVLGELRVFGAFGQLREKLAHDFGTTPVEAFAGVLRRLETDPAHAAIPPSTSVPLIFGLLAHSRGGLSEAAIVDLVETEVKLGAGQRGNIAASVALVLRQLRPYLAHREGRVDFFFDSFHFAAQQRYTRRDAELPVRSENDWHDALANWCATWERLKGASQRYALRWLPTHLMDAARAADAVEVITEFGYHHARLEKVGANDVLDVTRDFAVLAKARLPADQREAVETWQRFHDENAHFLRRPGLAPEVELVQKAYAHADTSPVTRGAGAWLETHNPKTWWFRRLGRPKEVVRNPCLRVLEGHTRPVWSVALHADGRRAVTGSWDKTVRVWDLDTGACLRTLHGHTDGVTSVALHVDGRRAVTGSEDKTVRVWDLDTGACLRVLEGHTDGVRSVALHADGRRAVTGGEDKTVRVWDLDTGACLRVLEGHTDGVRSVALHADGRRAVTGSWDKTVRVWDLDTGACLKTLHGHAGHVESVALHADGQRAVTGSWDKMVRVWDLDTGACLHVLEGHTDFVKSVALHADGRRAVTGSEDKTVRVWDLDTGACLRTLHGHAGHVESVALHADGRRAVTGSVDHTVRVWDLDKGACRRTLEGHFGHVESVALHADGRRAVTGSGEPRDKENTVQVWDLDTGACLRTLHGHTSGVRSVALHADGRRVVTASFDKTVREWDLDTGACLRMLGHTGSVWSVALHSDGRRVVTGSFDNTVRVWDLDTGACLRTLHGHTNMVKSVALHADGRRAVSGSWDKTVRVWDLDTGACLHVLEGHTDSVYSVALHADGRRAVTGSRDKTVRVWDLNTGACLRTLHVHTDGVTSVALHVDGRHAVTGSEDKTVRVWNLDTGACLGAWCGAATFFSVDLGKPLTDGRVHIAVGCGNDVLFFELMPPGPLTRTMLSGAA